jgi:undecaprenyl phosphate N,N'-diacetylbacillosamine 1-phosphate transferase
VTFYQRYSKRLFDLILTGAILVLFSWLLLLIVIMYLITFNLPIVFKQQRIGKGEKYFTMLKLRTLNGTDEDDIEHRRFWLGNVLRVTNLDELPQLWNVLIGDMSSVGPRPLPIAYKNLFTAEQQKRHTVLPGITGLAQVSGKNSLAWTDKFALDVHYVHKVSFRTDCIILLKTLTLVIALKRDVSLHERKLGT